MSGCVEGEQNVTADCSSSPPEATSIPDALEKPPKQQNCAFLQLLDLENLIPRQESDRSERSTQIPSTTLGSDEGEQNSASLLTTATSKP